MKIDFTDPKTHKKMLYTFYGLFLIIFLYGVYFVYTDLYSVYLMKDEVTIDMGNSYQIELLPKNSGKFDYKNYRFKSKNNDVVEVNDHGEIVSLKEGEAVVTVRFKNSLSKDKLKVVVKDVEVNELDVENNFEVTVNDTKKLNIKINNVDNISTSLIFESKDKSIATVDSYGNITGIKEGNTYINVTSGNGITKNVKVTVKASNARIQEIVIDEKEINMYVGQTITVNAHLLPTSASSKDLWWVSSNPQVVSVDKKGNIKALKEGYSVIGVFASKDLNAQVTVYVSEEEIVLNKYNIELEVGSSDKITANIPVTYSSSDNSIVSIDENGKIKALKEGKVTITATHNNKKNTCVVVVKNKEVKEEKPTTIDVKSIELSENNITLTEGDTKSISVSVKPNNATNKKVNYKSENANVASVDSNGVITAKSSGKTKIIFTSESNKNVKSELLVTVKTKTIEVSSISLNTTNKTLIEGDTFALTVTFMPKDATNKKITWTSKDSSIASVDSNGVVTAKDSGSTTITATTSNKKTATVNIYVERKTVDVKTLTINSNITSMYVGDTITLSASVTPANATNKKINWSSSDTNVASVDSYGKVTAKKSGSVVITAKSASNSSVYDTKSIAVNVKNVPVTKLTTKTTSYTLKYDKSYQWSVTIEPSNATNKQIVYSTSDSNIATVDSNGKITAKKVKGTATITAKAKENSSIKTTITITVVEDPLIRAANYKKVNYSNFIWKYYYTGRGPIGEYYSKSMPYAIYAPENISDLNGVSLPLIIWLHGGGQLEGKDFTSVGLPQVINKWSKTGLEKIPAIIIAPHTGNKWVTDSEFEMVKQSIDWAKSYYNIDLDNVVLMGHSMGGRGVVFLSYGMYHKYNKSFFSAIVAMTCNVAGAYPSDNGQDGYNYFSKVKKIRVYSEASESSGFLNWLGRSDQFVYLPNTNHGSVPYNSMTKDENNDGVSDLINWVFNLDGKSD